MLNKSTIYKSRFENCYVAENMNINCNNKSKIIVNSFREISKNFKKKYFVISLTTGNYDENKLSCDKILAKFSENYAILSGNLIFDNLFTKLYADQMEVDLIARTTKTSMFNKNNKIKIKHLTNGTY